MRLQATIAMFLVLLSGTLRFCPACELAAAAQGNRPAGEAAAGHACCPKGASPVDPAHPAPADSDSGEAPAGGDCAREHVTSILQAALPEIAIEFAAVPVLVVSLAVAEPERAPGGFVPHQARSHSPPGRASLSIPIRI